MPRLDQEAISIIGITPDTEALLLVTKEFLSKRKRKADPSRKYMKYFIRDVNNKSRIMLLTAAQSEDIIVGRASLRGDYFVIPVIRNHTRVELYAYGPHNNSISMIGKVTPGNYISAVYAVSDGYIVVSSRRERTDAIYYAYEGGHSTILTTELSDVRVDDVTELHGTLYVTVTGKIHKGDRQIWQISANRRTSSTLDFHRNIVKAASNILQASYLPITHKAPSLRIFSLSGGFLGNDAKMNIVSLDDKPSSVWEKKLPVIESGLKFSAVGICKSDYLISEIRTERDSHKSSIVFTYTGNPARTIQYPEITEQYTVLTRLLMFPTEDTVYVVTNFSKQEDVRRDGGWWSWYGFRVDQLNIENLCGA